MKKIVALLLALALMIAMATPVSGYDYDLLHESVTYEDAAEYTEQPVEYPVHADYDWQGWLHAWYRWWSRTRH